MVNIRDTVQLLLRSGVENSNTRPYILKVPRSLRDVNPKSFSPQVVSIGPLHSKEENVAVFEEQKATYMHGLLRRFELSPEQTLSAWVEKVSASIHRIRECYVGIEVYSDDELAKMMVIDGCFLIEFIHKALREEERDIVLVRSITDDILQVENQIPFFILKDIVSEIVPSIGTIIMDYIKEFLLNTSPFRSNFWTGENINCDHILSMQHQLIFSPDKIYVHSSAGWDLKFPSVVELDIAGVNFKPKKDEDWAGAMTLEWSRSASFVWFRVKPTLRMPMLVIDDSTESRLRNLIAYELLSRRKGIFFDYVRSYAIAMDMLIDTPEDIDILVNSKVCLNSLGSNEDAANMINNLCKDIPHKRFFYGEEAEQLRSYCNGYWPKLALLRRTYFNNPWSVTGLFAGIALFVLTLLQTIYAMKE